MKKKLAIFALSGIMLMSMPMTAFAHGHGHRSRGNTPAAGYSLCNVEDCNQTGTHQHDDVCYLGHFIGDGHDYHQACTVEDCSRTGCLDHDTTVCIPCADEIQEHCGGHDGKNHHTKREGR